MMLEVKDINTFYGLSHILFDFSLEVDEKETVALLGRNGGGRTTALRSIIGLTKARDGKIIFRDIDISDFPPYRISKLGIGFVPEDRRIFQRLTVKENLEIASKRKIRDASIRSWTIRDFFDIFEALELRANRPAGTLSGGEQQMLTIARTMMGNPYLVLFDEPTEGLAPLIVKEILKFIMLLKKENISSILSEQNVKFSLSAADRAYIIENGRLVYKGLKEELKQSPRIIEKYLAV